MGDKHFTLSEEQRKEYASGFLLDLMINKAFRYSVVLENDDKYLEPLFVYMMSKDYLNLDEKNYYSPTNQGVDKLDNLKKSMKSTWHILTCFALSI